jgi:micrococcal nuclease
LKIVASNLDVHHNQSAYITIKTAPGAHCSIEVDYKSGPSHAKGLNAKTAGSSGVVTWVWKVGPSTTLGTWSVYVTAGNRSLHTYLHVQRA